MRIERSVMVERSRQAGRLCIFYRQPNFLQARFMAEAKKPSRQLANADDCFQAARYGWNSNTPLAVLTDFEQLIVLDSRYKPTIETGNSAKTRQVSLQRFRGRGSLPKDLLPVLARSGR